MRREPVRSSGGARRALLALLFVALPAFRAYSAEDVRLKQGGRGELCLNCHDAFREKLKSPFVHTPVKQGDCTGCHNPHASSHEKMLSQDTTKVCFECHRDIVPQEAKSAHKVVVEGNCLKCHDPHGSNKSSNLRKAGNELCFECHKGKGEEIAKARFKHRPVEQSCLTCHSPHASSKAEHLLKSDPPSLCTGCHAPTSAGFTQSHMGYPVATARCTSCHNVHGSGRAAILYDNVHPPVANRLCRQCHDDPTSPNPFRTKREGLDLCQGCHGQLIDGFLAKKNLHWPVADRRGCLNCHSPHAGTTQGLLRAPMLETCGKCHRDTLERQARSATKHEPISSGNCPACHSVHGSDNVLLLAESSALEVCGQCHDWVTHASHPIGEAKKDPRNKGLTLDCTSCHRAHGTEYKGFTHLDPRKALCVPCHEKIGR